jgi:glyoxalase family protein
MSTLPTAGIHHITAIATDPQRNLDFYTQVMGLRLVKLTVNFDDPGTYHFYFGHENGAPGSILTFFPWPGAAPGSIGPGEVVAIAFAVSMESLAYWNARLRTHGVSAHADIERFGERVMRFRDPDGLWLELVAASRTVPVAVSRTGPVPPEHALLAFHSATLSEANPDRTAALANVMGYELEAYEGNRSRYHAVGQTAAILDVLHEAEAPRGRLGAGTVHHIAFRTPGNEQQLAWRDDLISRGYYVTPVIDRVYFHSIYFREPGGVLFEIATDPPGFAVDEPKEHLGEVLQLPSWLEPHRHDLQRQLPRLTRSRPDMPALPHVEHAAD